MFGALGINLNPAQLIATGEVLSIDVTNRSHAGIRSSLGLLGRALDDLA